jgi:hypothetical protein
MLQPSVATAEGLMVAATFTSIIGWTLGYLLLGLLLYMVGTRTMSEFRIWWARQTGRGSCRYCGRPLTVRVAGLLRIPEGFFGVCAWCGREQPES